MQQAQTTTVKKNVLDAEWEDESFEFCPLSPSNELVITFYDRDRLKRHDFIGNFVMEVIIAMRFHYSSYTCTLATRYVSIADAVRRVIRGIAQQML